MVIKTTLSTNPSRYIHNEKMYFFTEGKIYVYENDLMLEIGLSPLSNKYDTIYGFSDVLIKNNIMILQSYEAIINNDSQINEIIMYDLENTCIKDRYNLNIILSGVMNKRNELFSRYIEFDKEYYCLYNFVNKKKYFLCSVDNNTSNWGEIKDSKYVFIGDKKFNCSIVNIELNQICFELNLQPYFVSSPLWANGEPMFRQCISNVLYCQTFNIIICFLKPYKIVGINAENGEVVWEQKFIINTDNFVIDNETGMIYALDAVWDNEKDKRTILYQVINAGNGEIEFERDLYEELNGETEPFNVHIHFAGFYEDAIYFSLYERGELYKASKFSANILEKYKHDKEFYGSPEIFNNRLFVAEDDDKMKQLLVFEI